MFDRLKRNRKIADRESAKFNHIVFDLLQLLAPVKSMHLDTIGLLNLDAMF